ncbi:MAG: hypothetical protein H0X39_01765 [Actinobacteria bacterium]|nr:hypothetical protein [Actinomycetota bacterium]
MEANRTRRTPDSEASGTLVDGELIIPGDALAFEEDEWGVEWEDLGFPLKTFEGAFLVGPNRDWCEQAVATAKPTFCDTSRRFLASIETGKAFALPCLSWSCEKCNRRKWHAARELFRLGIEAAWARDERVRFLTLTVENEDISAQELAQAWGRLATALRRGEPAPRRPEKPKLLRTEAQQADWQKTWDDWLKACKRRNRKPYLDQYAAVIELGGRTGRIHMHVLMTGRYIAHARLRQMAVSAGFGRVSYITLVRNDGDAAMSMASYAGKMASYTAKASRVAEELRARGSLRAHPVRTSAKWLEGGLRKIEEDKGIRKKKRGPNDPPPKDRGPWAMIQINQSGDAEWMMTVGDETTLPRWSERGA